MSSNFYSVGLSHVGAYQVSGVPYLSGSNLPGNTSDSLKFEFPKVTKSVTVQCNHSDPIRVHFAPFDAAISPYEKGASTQSNFVIIASSGSQTFDVKCKEIFISMTAGTAGTSNDDVQVYAELTSIPSERMFSLDNVEGVAT